MFVILQYVEIKINICFHMRNILIQKEIGETENEAKKENDCIINYCDYCVAYYYIDCGLHLSQHESFCDW